MFPLLKGAYDLLTCKFQLISSFNIEIYVLEEYKLRAGRLEEEILFKRHVLDYLQRISALLEQLFSDLWTVRMERSPGMYRLELWILTKKCPVSSGSFSSSAALPLEADGASSRRCRSCMWKKKRPSPARNFSISPAWAGAFRGQWRESSLQNSATAAAWSSSACCSFRRVAPFPSIFLQNIVY